MSAKTGTLLHRLRYILVAMLSLSPLLMFHGRFAELFWFGDDWDQFRLILQGGFWPWVWQPFAENWVPLFKMIWGGIAVGTGSHLLMIWVLWVAHAATAACLASLLHRCGLSFLSSAFAALVFALSASNVETLAWTTQFSAVLAAFFFLLALRVDLAWEQRGAAAGWRREAWVLMMLLAACLSFSRGVLSGAAMAGAALIGAFLRRGRGDALWPILRRSALYLLPGLLVAGVILLGAQGNHRQMQPQQWAEAVTYAGWFFALNPLFRSLSVDSWGIHTVAVVAAIKLLIITCGMLRAGPRLRSLLWVFLLFDVANAALVGLGRFHTGLPTCVGSRYQYSALICLLPFVGILVDELALRAGRILPRPVALLLLAVLAFLAIHQASRGWALEADFYAEHRGRYTRSLLFGSPQAADNPPMPGIPFLYSDEAKDITARLNLH